MEFGEENLPVEIEQALEQEGIYVCTVVGVSMYPLLRNRKDTIVVTPVQGCLKKYDVPLYRSGGRYVLHRIVDVQKDLYIIIGDNCEAREYVRDAQVIGVLSGFYRGKRYFTTEDRGYQMYSRCWVALYPVRRIWKKARRILIHGIKRMIGRR